MSNGFRAPPLLLAAAALVAGDGLGLRAGAWLGTAVRDPSVRGRLPVAVPTPDRPAVVAALFLLLAGTVLLLVLRRGLASPRGVGPPLAAALLAGISLGVGAGGRVVGSCTANLRTGEEVRVRGLPETDVQPPPAGRPGVAPPGPRGRWARAVLRSAEVEGPAGTCSLPRLLVRVERPDRRLPAGRAIAVRGEWRSFGAGEGLRPVEHRGAVYGEVAGVAADAPRSPGEGRPARPDRASEPDHALSLAGLRARAARRLERILSPELVPVGRALLLADRSDLDPAVTRRFADAGLVHLLAISGLHIGILGGGLLWLLGFATRGPGRWAATCAVTGGYVLLIGAPPAAVRAVLLFAGVAAGRWRGAPARAGDILGLAAIVALVARPALLLHPGFQLSFAGFAGIGAGAWAGDRLRARLRSARDGAGGFPARVRRVAGGLVPLLAASTGAFAFTAPIAAAHFGRVAPAAIVSNLVATPVLSLALGGLAVAMVAPPGIAGTLAAGAGVAIRALDRIAGFFASLPLHGDVAGPRGEGWIVLLLLVGAAAAALSGRRWRAALPLGAAACVWLGAPALHGLAARGGTLLCTLDVGQGDAAVLRTRSGRWIVLDAGPGPGAVPGPGVSSGPRVGTGPGGGSRGRRGFQPGAGSRDAGRRVVTPFLRDRGGHEVALFVLSHPHLDHLGGAGALFDAFRVRRVLDAGRPLPSGPYVDFLDRVEEEGAEWLPADAGARARVDEVELLVLGPEPPRAPGRRVSLLRDPAAERLGTPDPNDVSVIVRVRVDGSFVYLNTGDAPAEAERAVLRAWPEDSLRADVLKLGHHGSRTSSAVPWLRAVRPELVLLSVGGRNRYGHPHPEVLARLDSAEVGSVWRTDRDGTLCLEVRPGGDWRVLSARRPGLDRGADAR